MHPAISSPRVSAAAAALLTLVSSASAQTYDLQAALAGAQPTPPNPAGNFSFGQYTGGVDPATFAIFTTFDESIGGTGLDAFYTPFPDPNVLYNDTGTTFSGFGFTMNDGEVSLGPAGGPAVVRFTAPAAGDYQISTEFLRIQTSNSDSTAYVFRNGTQLGTGTAGFTPFTFSGTQTLAAGDTIDFAAAGTNAGGGNATTRLTATLTAVPEPTSVALLGAGALALLVNRRKRD